MRTNPGETRLALIESARRINKDPYQQEGRALAVYAELSPQAQNDIAHVCNAMCNNMKELHFERRGNENSGFGALAALVTLLALVQADEVDKLFCSKRD